jgi:hypothetical protein
MFGIKLFFTGMWPLVWHWGIPVGTILLCLAAEVAIQLVGNSVPFVDKVLRPLQKDLLWVAVAAGLFLYGFSDGVRVEHARSVAQGNALTKQIGDVVDDVMRDPANQPQPEAKTPLKKGQKRPPRVPPRDAWDSKDN